MDDITNHVKSALGAFFPTTPLITLFGGALSAFSALSIEAGQPATQGRYSIAALPGASGQERHGLLLIQKLTGAGIVWAGGGAPGIVVLALLVALLSTVVCLIYYLTNLRRARRQVEAQMFRINDVCMELQDQKERLEDANLRLSALATTDGLTGLHNRRAFHDRMELEWQRAARYHTCLSLIMLDVDNFKPYNDTYGHPAGDAVLETVATVLRAGIRETDFVARYGGEEFAVLLPETDGAAAQQIAERLRSAIQVYRWPLRAITASAGIATVDPTVPAAATLLDRADQALYRAKEQGRNQVTHFDCA